MKAREDLPVMADSGLNIESAAAFGAVKLIKDKRK